MLSLPMGLGSIPGGRTKIPHSIQCGVAKNECAGEGVEKRKPSYIAGGNVNGAVRMENSAEVPQKTKNRAAT